jgi:hypothetical protein
VPTTIDTIYEAVDGLTEKLADVNANRHLLRMAVDGLSVTIDGEQVDGLHAMADAFDADISACLIELDYLRQLVIDFRRQPVIDFRAEQNKPVAKKKGKARAAAKKRKTRSK